MLLPLLAAGLAAGLAALATAVVNTMYNAYDADGCTHGQEFRASACRPCRPGTYRYISPLTNFTTSARATVLAPPRRLSPLNVAGLGDVSAHVYQIWPELDDYALPPPLTRCVACPNGTVFAHFGGVHPGVCTKCPPGTYASKKTTCLPCRTDAAAPRAAKCLPCPGGTYARPSGARAAAGELCASCPAGKGTPKRGGAVGIASCRRCGSAGIACPCPPERAWTEWNWRYYRDWKEYYASFRRGASKKCTRCPPFTVTNDALATRAADCKPCDAREAFGERYGVVPICTECRAPAVANGTVCLVPDGAACPSKTFLSRRGTCIRCPAGFAKRSGFCARCPAGKVSNKARTKCVACKRPFVPALDGSKCMCPRNTAHDTDPDRCVPCKRGFEVDDDAHLTTSCDARPCSGDAQRNEEGNCEPCHPKMRAVQGIREKTCKIPQTGCAGGELLSVNLKHGFVISFKCKPARCGPRNAVSDAGYTCTPCGPGAKAVLEDGSYSCTPCEKNEITGGPLATRCLRCFGGARRDREDGSVCECLAAGKGAAGDGRLCKPCEPGSFSGTTSSRCKKCSPGAFTFGAGRTMCELCPPGTFANGWGSSSCRKCPAGKRGNKGVGAKGSTKCVKA